MEAAVRAVVPRHPAMPLPSSTPLAHCSPGIPSAERLYGWKETEVLGKPFLELVKAELPRPLGSDRKYSAERGLLGIRAQGESHDGREHQSVASRWTVWRNDAGAALGRLHLDTDVTKFRRAEQQLRVVSGHLLNLRDEERRRLGRDLHDSAGQLLSMAKLNLSLAQDQLGTRQSTRRCLPEECSSLIDQALADVRTISYLLHPPLLEELGLVGVLPWYVSGFSERSRIKVQSRDSQGDGPASASPWSSASFASCRSASPTCIAIPIAPLPRLSLSLGNKQVTAQGRRSGQGHGDDDKRKVGIRAEPRAWVSAAFASECQSRRLHANPQRRLGHGRGGRLSLRLKSLSEADSVTF